MSAVLKSKTLFSNSCNRANRGIGSLVLLILLLGFMGYSQTSVISGIVSENGKPLQGVAVSVKESDKGTFTDELGRYRITVSSKQVLVFSYVGMKSVTIMVEDVSRVMNIEMEPQVEELDEVIVSKRKKITQKSLAQNYFNDPTIVRSNHGYLSPKKVGYELRVVDGKDLDPKSRDILAALAQQLPGTVVRERQGERFLFQMSRGSLRGAPPVAYEVDGRLFTEAPVWLNIKTVLRCAVIPSDQAVYLYGKIGVGGIVVINTTNILHGEREDDDRPYDLARLRTNTYTNDALDPMEMVENGPGYLKKFYSSKSLEKAKEVYYENKKLYGSLYSYVLDSFVFFQERFENPEMAKMIIEENNHLFEKNPMALKALAYHYQSYGDLQAAHAIYKNLYKMRPAYAQSFMDLANSYRDIRNFKQSATIYGRYEYLRRNNYLSKDSTSFLQMVDRDFNNLLALRGKEILQKTDIDKQTRGETFKGTRLVFEWNDGEAEFALQFVNPKGYYYEEIHSNEADPTRIQNEKLIGYSSKEFLIDESMVGTWQVNAKYLGNKSMTPAYLKVTIYHNYGEPAQRHEYKVFKLGLKRVNQQLFKVKNNTGIVSN